MQRGEAASELFVERRLAAARFDPLEHEVIVADVEDLRHPKLVAIAQPVETLGLGREHPARRGPVLLYEHPPSVGELDPVRRVDVAARHRLSGADGASERSRQARRQLSPHQSPCCFRRCAMKPRQAASHKSNTSSKPSAPP